MVCPVCIAAPVAIAAGTIITAKGAKERENAADTLIMWGGILLILSAIGFFVFYKTDKSCTDCSIYK